MKLYKVATLHKINYRKFKRMHSQWFTTNESIIYAENIDDAELKYKKMIFDNYLYTNYDLKYLTRRANTISENFIFDLPFYYKIITFTHEIKVYPEEIYDSIDVLKTQMSGVDFKSWLFDNNNVNDYCFK